MTTLPENTAFKNGVQWAFDSTSIGAFKTCARKYYYSIVLGYEPRSIPPPLAFGIAFHSILEHWHRTLASGTDKHTALINTVRLAGTLGETLPAGDTARSKETLLRTVVCYLDTFWDDKAITVIKPNGQPAVEYHFQLPFMDYQGLEVFICGHLDRVVKWQGETLVLDYKTTKYTLDGKFFDNFKPSTQLALYVTACHLVANSLGDLPAAHGVIIDGIQLGVNFSRFARQIVPYSLEEIDEYIIDLQYWIKQAMDACKNNYFPQNTESCNKFSGCHFREICSKPPARRQVFLDGNFTKRIWDPTRER